MNFGMGKEITGEKQWCYAERGKRGFNCDKQE